MPPITPVNFNTMAYDMLHSVAKNSPARKTYIRNFYRAANESRDPGNAIISYFTELNRFKDTNKKNIVEKIEKEINETPELKKETDKFLDVLYALYPKTRATRVSIASQGAVAADRVEPKSNFKKFMMFINKLIREE